MTLISATLPDSAKTWSACWRAHGLLALVYQRVLSVATARGEDASVTVEEYPGCLPWARVRTEGAPEGQRIDVAIESATGTLNWLGEYDAPEVVPGADDPASDAWVHAQQVGLELAFSERAIAESALRVLPDLRLELVDKDATLSWYVRSPVWLSEDGCLAMSHPTDPRGGEIGAPEDGRYEPVTDPEEEERSYDEYVRQQDARFAARR